MKANIIRRLPLLVGAIFLVSAVCLTGCAAQPAATSAADPAAESQAAASSGTEASNTAEASGSAAASSGTQYADIEVADYGTITIELDPVSAPKTVENFVDLAESGFYDGLTFHRIMEGFMIQGGDPLGNGTGGSDETIIGEFSQNGYDNPISHVRGTVSMARSNDPDSASSQFFIVHADSVFLDGSYAGFGHVVEGMDVVDAIAEDAVPVDSNGTISASEQPIITSITIHS